MQKHGNPHQLFACMQLFSDILFIVTFIAFFLKYHKIMQAMLATFITMNTSGIPPIKANPISKMFPPLYNKSPRKRSNSQRFKGHRRNPNYHKSYFIHCMCDCSYYNIISNLQKMLLYVFNCKILFPILSDFDNFKRHWIYLWIYLWKLPTL